MSFSFDPTMTLPPVIVPGSKDEGSYYDNTGRPIEMPTYDIASDHDELRLDVINVQGIAPPPPSIPDSFEFLSIATTHSSAQGTWYTVTLDPRDGVCGYFDLDGSESYTQGDLTPDEYGNYVFEGRSLGDILSQFDTWTQTDCPYVA